MIKYKEQSYDEYVKYHDDLVYGNNEVPFSDYSVLNLKHYMKWIIEDYREKFGLNKSGPVKRIKILEPGAKMGEAGVALAYWFDKKEVVYKGMEFSKRLVADSRKHHRFLFQGDITDCPEVRSGSFDIVYARTLFGFLKDIPQAIKEMIRLVTSPGQLIIIQPVPYPIGAYHYNSMDSLEDLEQCITLSGYDYKIFPHIPVYREDNGEPIFNEPIIIVEK